MKLKTWITNGTKHPFYAKKIIELAECPEKAVIQVCGLGQFNLYVNGKKVGDHMLDPAWTDYNKLIYYVTFEITDYLSKGENEIAAEVGNGWYLCDEEGGYFFHFPSFMPPNPNPYRPYGKQLLLSAHLEITEKDGKTLICDTDDSWKVKNHEIKHSNCYGSEVMDGRNKAEQWNQALIAEKASVPKGILEEQKMPPVKVLKTYEGKLLGQVNGRSIYDFSMNVSGMLEFEVCGMRGDVIRAYPAEKLGKDGDVDQMAKNWLPIDVCETYIIGENNVWEKFEMKFTYFGGRYVAVDLGSARIRNIRIHAISSATEKAGEFSCDDKRFIQIYQLIEKAVEANMLSVHTDCPTIERFAWQEENHLMAPSIMYMMQVKSHWEKFLKDTRIAQHKAKDYFSDMTGHKIYPGEGLIPSQAPCYIPNVLPVPGMGDFYDIIGWGSSIIIGTYWHYTFYGDEQIIRDNYEAGKRYFAHLQTKVTEEGFINHGLGDWGNPAGAYARENVETVFLYADAKLLSMFANIMGEDKDAEEFRTYAEKIKVNYNNMLLVLNKQTGRYCYRVWDTQDSDSPVLTQAAQAMPLYWGMVPEDKKNDVAESLKQTVIDSGCFLTGEIGLPYIIQTLSEYGMNDLICEMILRTEHPSYYAFVIAGETTLGEYWEDNPRSHCHDMMGHIIEWYYNGIAGIRPLLPGYKKVMIRPYLPKTMNEMKCTYRSIRGPITVALKRRDNKVELSYSAPDSIEVCVDKKFLNISGESV